MEQSTQEWQTWPEVRFRTRELYPVIYFCFLLPQASSVFVRIKFPSISVKIGLNLYYKKLRYMLNHISMQPYLPLSERKATEMSRTIPKLKVLFRFLRSHPPLPWGRGDNTSFFSVYGQ